MDSIARNISVDYGILKEPRGFLRIIQFVLSIFAFATVSSSTQMNVVANCGNNSTSSSVTRTLSISYPFRIHDDVSIQVPLCGKPSETITPFGGNFSASSQFFCFVGVMSFLICIALTIGYVVFSSVFTKGSRAASVDFIFACIWTVIWFIASTAWADNLAKLRAYLDPATVIKDLTTYCAAPHCSAEAANYSSLIVSVLFGFLNFVVWGAGIWFLFKETAWHKENDSAAEGFDQPQAPASSTSQAEDGYQAPTY